MPRIIRTGPAGTRTSPTTRRCRLAAAGAAGALLVVTAAGPAHAATFVEFTIPTAGSNTLNVSAGPAGDGNVWFSEVFGEKIGKITPAGVITEYPLPAGIGPQGLTGGPDGRIWFAEAQVGHTGGNTIGRINTDGTGYTNFKVKGAQNQGVRYLTTGSDGNLWFTMQLSDRVGKITPAGKITTWAVGASRQPWGITLGPDGAIWFTMTAGNAIGRITTAGVMTEFAVPTAASQPLGITVGPDNNLWFVEGNANKVARLTTAGVFTEFALPTASAGARQVASGPDGNLWVTEFLANQVAQVTPTGTITEFATPGARPFGITRGADNNLWLAENVANKIARLTP